MQAALIKAAEQDDRLAHQQLLGELGFLKGDADAFLDGRVLPPPVHTEDLDGAGGRVGQPFDDLDGGGLAGAVGSEEAEALADLDGQIEAAHRLDGRPAFIALEQSGAADGGSHGDDYRDGGRGWTRLRFTQRTSIVDIQFNLHYNSTSREGGSL